MARPIEATPTLSGEDAERFLDRLKHPEKYPAVQKVDFEAAKQAILKKAQQSGKKYF